MNLDVGSPQLFRQSLPIAQQAMATGIWNAHLRLTLAHTRRGVRVTESDRHGPLYTQKALYPEGQNLPHLYLLHPPGGLVSGDHLEVSLDLRENAAALVTSPGAGRLYRARPDQKPQRQENRLHLKPGSHLEWFPMETLVYSGANAETNTQVHLEQDSKFIGWDICALGLPSSDAPFKEGSLRQAFEIYQDGRPQIIERIALDAKDTRFLNNPAGFAGMTCNALFVAGPFSDESMQAELEQANTKLVEICDQASRGTNNRGPNIACSNTDSAKPGNVKTDSAKTQAQMSKPAASANAMMGVSLQGNWLVVRYLGESTSRAQDAFVHCWSVVRPILLKREACEPRIWAC